MIQTPAQCWEEYRRKAVTPDASPVQIAETRRAFMAGMIAMDTVMNDIGGLPDGEDLDALKAIREDLFGIALAYVAPGGGSHPLTTKRATTLSTLWRTRLNTRGGKDEFLFRSTADVSEAANLAQRLLDESPAGEIFGSQIVAVERVAKLWN